MDMPNNEEGWRPRGYNGPGWEPPKDPPEGPPPGDGGPPKGRSPWSLPGVAGVIAVVIWCVLAYQWTEQNDCEAVESFGLVLSHGTPDPWEACGD